MVTIETRPEIVTPVTAASADTQTRKQVPGRFVIDAASAEKDSSAQPHQQQPADQKGLCSRHLSFVIRRRAKFWAVPTNHLLLGGDLLLRKYKMNPHSANN